MQLSKIFWHLSSASKLLHKALVLSLALLAGIELTACRDGREQPLPELSESQDSALTVETNNVIFTKDQIFEGKLASLRLVPETVVLNLGESLNFTVLGLFSEDNFKDLTGNAKHNIELGTVARAEQDADGKYKIFGQSSGVSKITSSFGDLSVEGKIVVRYADGSLPLDPATGKEVVLPPPTVGKPLAKVSALQVAPIEANVGRSLELKATATFIDGTSAEVTDSVTWIVKDSRLAVIDKNAAKKWALLPLAAGTTSVDVSLDGVTVNVSINNTQLSLRCLAPYTVVYQSQTLPLSWAAKNVSASLTQTQAGSTAAAIGGAAPANINGEMNATYTPPSLFSGEMEVDVIARPDDLTIAPGTCRFKVRGENAPYAEKDVGQTRGLTGVARQYEPGFDEFSGAPRFTAMEDVIFAGPVTATFFIHQLNRPLLKHDGRIDGPKIAGSTAYGITFSGFIEAPTAGTYTFYVETNDDHFLYIKGNKVNPSCTPGPVQAANASFIPGTTAVGNSLSLTAGKHPIKIDLDAKTSPHSLRFWWKIPGSANFVIVPSDKLSRP